MQRQRRGGACSCMRREPDASRRRSLRASPRTPGLRTVRLGGGGVSGSGRGEGACKITTAPRHEAEGGVRLRSGAASRTAVRRVIDSSSIAPLTGASLRVACSAPAISSRATVTHGQARLRRHQHSYGDARAACRLATRFA